MEKPLEPSVNGAIPPITITIADQMQLIAEETAHGRSIGFVSLLRKPQAGWK